MLKFTNLNHKRDIDNLFVGNKYIDFGKECKTHSKNFLWDKIIENYKRIL